MSSCPAPDGFAVCRQLKDGEATRAIPVLFVTAKDDTESLLRGFRCGAVDYISKPFQADEVLVRVETHLKIARLTRELMRPERGARGGDRPASGSGRRAARGDRASGHPVRAGHAALGHFRIRRPQPAVAADPLGDRAAASVRRHQRVDHRRERHRQRAGGARDSLQQPARIGSVHSRELRRDSRRAGRIACCSATCAARSPGH